MNAAQFRKEYFIIENQAKNQLIELAEQLRLKVIKPYCDKHNLWFWHINGDYYFQDINGNKLNTLGGNFKGERNIPKYIKEKLDMESKLFRWQLFSYIQDYDGRNNNSR